MSDTVPDHVSETAPNSAGNPNDTSTSTTDSSSSTTGQVSTTSDTSGTILPCVDADLGSSLGYALLVDTSANAGDEYQPACDTNCDDDIACGHDEGAAGSECYTSGIVDDGLLQGCGTTAFDFAVSWTAPADGMYLFSLAGSDYDTVLAIYDAPAGDPCGGAMQACNDDCGGMESEIARNLFAGQQVILVIEGDSWNHDDGSGGAPALFTLNILEVTEGPDCATPGGG